MTQNLYTDFEEAYNLNEKNFSQEEIMHFLQTGNIPQRQIAAIKLQTINSIEEAKILLDNLTGVDGKIREAVAHRIFRILLNQPDKKKLFLQVENIAEIFANATIDINSNICRIVIDSAILLNDENNFAKKYTKIIVKYAQNAIEELDKFIFRDKKYVINKQLFKLYWCLESLKFFNQYTNFNELNFVLEKSAIQKEYTVREKVAQVIIDREEFDNLKKTLINDENYYVRNVFTKSS